MISDDPIAKFFIPRYTELALFSMSLVFVLLFFTQAELRFESFELFFDDGELLDYFNPKVYVVIGCLILGLIFSAYHVFTDRPKTNFEKGAMVMFAVAANGLSGIAAGIHLLGNSQGFFWVFPIWNIANGLLLLLIGGGVSEENNFYMAEEDATLFQVLFGTIVVVTIFLICSFGFNMYWALTFSICVAVCGVLENIVDLFQKA